MVIKHSAINLPELSLVTKYKPLALLTNTNTPNTTNSKLSLFKEEMISLFDSFSKSDLDSILNSSPLSPLEQEYQYYHHRLKYLSPRHIQHLIDIGVLPKRLWSVKPPPCLACLLGKSKKHL